MNPLNLFVVWWLVFSPDNNGLHYWIGLLLLFNFFFFLFLIYLQCFTLTGQDQRIVPKLPSIPAKAFSISCFVSGFLSSSSMPVIAKLVRVTLHSCALQNQSNKHKQTNTTTTTTQMAAMALEKDHMNTATKTRIAYGNFGWHASKYKVHKLHQRYILIINGHNLSQLTGLIKMHSGSG